MPGSLRACGHTPHGVCGLKFDLYPTLSTDKRHTPHGVCGLKLSVYMTEGRVSTSHPSRGVWIEIGCDPALC